MTYLCARAQVNWSGMQYCKIETGQRPAKIYLPTSFMNKLQLKKCCYRLRSTSCIPSKLDPCDAKFKALIAAGCITMNTETRGAKRKEIEEQTDTMRKKAAAKARTKFLMKPCGLFEKGLCNYLFPGFTCPFVHGNAEKARSIPCCSQRDGYRCYYRADNCPYGGHVEPAVCPQTAQQSEDDPDAELMPPDDLT